MLGFDHPNVLKLLGVCFDTEDKLPIIVLPFMENGDLKSFLSGKRNRHSNEQLPEVGILISVYVASSNIYYVFTGFNSDYSDEYVPGHCQGNGLFV